MLGKLLRRVRAGESKLAWHHPNVTAPDTITLSSTAFADQSTIPERHVAAGGENLSPPLSWTGIPDDAVELVLIVEDPDAPTPVPIVHCVATGIAPNVTEIGESELSAKDPTSTSVTIGKASMGQRGYHGPAPVPGHGPHRYVFQLFALDRPSGLSHEATKKTLLEAIHGSVIARGRLTGTYER